MAKWKIKKRGTPSTVNLFGDKVAFPLKKESVFPLASYRPLFWVFAGDKISWISGGTQEKMNKVAFDFTADYLDLQGQANPDEPLTGLNESQRLALLNLWQQNGLNTLWSDVNLTIGMPPHDKWVINPQSGKNFEKVSYAEQISENLLAIERGDQDVIQAISDSTGPTGWKFVNSSTARNPTYFKFRGPMIFTPYNIANRPWFKENFKGEFGQFLLKLLQIDFTNNPSDLGTASTEFPIDFKLYAQFAIQYATRYEIELLTQRLDRADDTGQQFLDYIEVAYDAAKIIVTKGASFPEPGFDSVKRIFGGVFGKPVDPIPAEPGPPTQTISGIKNKPPTVDDPNIELPSQVVKGLDPNAAEGAADAARGGGSNLVSGAAGAAQGAVGGLADQAQGAVGGLTGAAGGLAGQAQGALGGLTGAAGGLAGQAQGAVGGLTGAAGGLAGQAQGAVSGLTGAAGGLAGQAQGALGGIGGGIQNAVGGVTGGIGNAVSGVTGAVGGAVSGVTGAVGGAVSGVTGAVGGALSNIPGVGGALGGAVSGVGGAVGGLTSGIGGSVGGLTSGIGDAVGGAVSGAGGVLNNLGSGLVGGAAVGAGLGALVGKGKGSLIGAAGGALAGGALDKLNPKGLVPDGLGKNWSPDKFSPESIAGNNVKIDAKTGAISNIKDKVGGLSSKVGGAVSGVAGGIGNAVSGVAGGIGNAVSGVTGAVGGAVSGVTGAVGGAVSGVTGAVGGALGNIPGVGGALGGAVSGVGGAVGGLTSGIGGAAGDLVGNIGGTAGNLVGNVGTSLTPGGGGLGGIASSVGGAVSGVGGAVGGAVGGVAGSATGAVKNIPGLGNPVGNLVSGAGGAVSNVVGGISGGVGGGLGKVGGGLSGATSAATVAATAKLDSAKSTLSSVQSDMPVPKIPQGASSPRIKTVEIKKPEPKVEKPTKSIEQQEKEAYEKLKTLMPQYISDYISTYEKTKAMGLPDPYGNYWKGGGSVPTYLKTFQRKLGISYNRFNKDDETRNPWLTYYGGIKREFNDEKWKWERLSRDIRSKRKTEKLFEQLLENFGYAKVEELKNKAGEMPVPYDWTGIQIN